MDLDTLDMSSVDGYRQSYPTPPPMPEEVTLDMSPGGSEPQKKKRKAWGQPVPEIKQILPPRKRAKTAEEKEQRKNERILRNRRAADKSRQRQKAAVAELEVKTDRIEQENAMLRHLIAQYQQRFGVPSDLQTSFSTFTGPTEVDSQPSPLLLDDADVPTTPSSYTASTSRRQSVAFPMAPPPSFKNDSLVITPDLNKLDTQMNDKSEVSEQIGYPTTTSASAMTQYPAAILCDLQCQAETGVFKVLNQPNFKLGLSHLLQLIQYLTIFQTFSTTTLLPMYQIFQILGQKLATSSVEQSLPSILNSFPLIHSLISLPSTPTRPAVFRLKLLSRLLACSPLMARLLLAAADRALQQVVSEDGFAEDPERRWTWSSLMTIKWGILRLEREHRKVRHGIQLVDHDVLRRHIMEGVDFGAVTRSSRMWEEINCNNSDMRPHYEIPIGIEAN